MEDAMKPLLTRDDVDAIRQTAASHTMLCGCLADGSRFCHEHACPRCTSDKFGPVYCDAHRPKPPAPPADACALCHRLDDRPMNTGKDGPRWHEECAS
jgi:hypothetical protein